jgi:hypothetical protein
MSGNPIDALNDNNVTVTKYSNTDNYDTTDDNIPFVDVDHRDAYFSDMHYKLGMIQLGSIVGTLSNYDLVSISATGVLTKIIATPLAVTDVIGMVYPVDNGSALAYTIAPNNYYYIVVSSQFISIPRTAVYFDPSDWTYPEAGARLVTAVPVPPAVEVPAVVGDYIYYDPVTMKFILFPLDATIGDIPSTYNPTGLLADNAVTPVILKIGKVLALTNTEVIMSFGIQNYGTGVLGVAEHAGLADVLSELVTTPSGLTGWTEGHYGYIPRILRVTRSTVDAALIAAGYGQVAELVATPVTNVPKYQLSACTTGSSTVGIYLYDDGTYCYFMVKGLWDSTPLAALTWAVAPANAGLSVWDDGNSVSGGVTATRPTYDSTPAVGDEEIIRFIGTVISTAGAGTEVVYINTQNGINKAIDYALSVYTNSVAPSSETSNLQVVEGWGNVTVNDASDPWYNVDYKTDLAKVHSDASVHIAHVFTDEVTKTDWFVLSENCFMNDLNYDVGDYSTTRTDNYQVNQYNENQATQDTTTDDEWYSGSGANGSFRAGTRTWASCQETTCFGDDGITLIDIVSNTTTKTLTFTSASNIYWWNDTITDYDLGLRPNIPWVGCMVLVHDLVASAERAMLFSYEGYSGWNTTTFTFYNVNILNDSAAAVSLSCGDSAVSPGGFANEINITGYAGTLPIGSAVVYTTSGSTPIAALTPGLTYYVIAGSDADHFSLSLVSGGAAIVLVAPAGGDTHTFTMYARISDWVCNPSWVAGSSSGGWTNNATADHWKLLPMYAGGLRLKIQGAAATKFSKFRIIPPIVSGAGSVLFWHHFKKCGISALGSSSTTGLNDGGMIYDEASVAGWDVVNDNDTAAAMAGGFWESSTTCLENQGPGAGTYRTDYVFDRFASNVAELDISDIYNNNDLIGQVHRPFPFPGNTLDLTAIGSPITAGNITVYNAATDEYTLDVTAGADPSAVFLNLAAAPGGIDTFMIGSRIDIESGVVGTPWVTGGLITGVSNVAGSLNVIFKYPTDVSVVYAPASTVHWRVYNTMDNVVNSPSVLAMSEQEVWLDVSKKSFNRAFAMLFSTTNAIDSDSIEVTVAQSSFNDGIRHLKNVMVGTELFRYLVEGDKVKFFIKPRLSSPSMIQY